MSNTFLLMIGLLDGGVKELGVLVAMCLAWLFALYRSWLVAARAIGKLPMPRPQDNDDDDDLDDVSEGDLVLIKKSGELGFVGIASIENPFTGIIFDLGDVPEDCEGSDLFSRPPSEAFARFRSLMLVQIVSLFVLLNGAMLLPIVWVALHFQIFHMTTPAALLCIHSLYWLCHDMLNAPALLGILTDWTPSGFRPLGRFVPPLVGLFWLLYMKSASLSLVLALMMLWSMLALATFFQERGSNAKDQHVYRKHHVMTIYTLLVIVVVSTYQRHIWVLTLTVELFFAGFCLVIGSSWQNAPLPSSSAVSLIIQVGMCGLWLALVVIDQFLLVWLYSIAVLIWFIFSMLLIVWIYHNIAFLGDGEDQARLLIESEGEVSEEEFEGEVSGDAKTDFLALSVKLAFVLILVWTSSMACILIRDIEFGHGDVLWNGSAQGSQASAKLSKLLHLREKLPLWMNMCSCFLKPIILTRIFGVPTTADTTPSAVKLYIVAPFVVLLTILTWLFDFHFIKNIITTSDLNEIEGPAFCIVVVAVSSNLQTALAFGTMLLNYQSLCGGSVKLALLKMGKYQGWMWVSVMGLTSLLFLPWILVGAIVAVPGMLCFGWLVAPFLVVAHFYWSVLKREAYRENSFIASLLGTSQVVASGKLGKLGDSPPTCPRGHILLPVRGPPFECDGLDPDSGDGGYRRQENEHGCLGKAESCFRCVSCSFDLCVFCYAEEKSFRESVGKLEFLSLVETVQSLHAEMAIECSSYYDDAVRTADAEVRVEQAKQRALTMIPLVPVLGAFAPMFLPVAMRFYFCAGYKNAFVHTWEDRHIGTFIDSLTNMSVKDLHRGKDVLHAIGAGDCNGAIDMIITWLQTLNYII